MQKSLYRLVYLIVLLITIPVLAGEYPTPTSWVNDYAGVLNTAQKQELDSLLKDFEQTTTNQIFVCIMPNLPTGTTLEEYVNELFTRWQPGQQGKDNGVLLAIFINDRKLRIEVGYGLEARLTDAASRLIIANDISPSFKEGKYYQGIKNGLKKIILTIKGEYRPRPPAYKPNILQRIQYFLYDGVDRILTSESTMHVLAYLIIGALLLAISAFIVSVLYDILRPVLDPVFIVLLRPFASKNRRIHRILATLRMEQKWRNRSWSSRSRTNNQSSGSSRIESSDTSRNSNQSNQIENSNTSRNSNQSSQIESSNTSRNSNQSSGSSRNESSNNSRDSSRSSGSKKSSPPRKFSGGSGGRSGGGGASGGW